MSHVNPTHATKTDLCHNEYVTADNVDTEMKQNLYKHRQVLPKNSTIIVSGSSFLKEQ
jgi:hypothetical protein